MITLSVVMALQMTGYVIVLPLFARRFGDFGAGVQALAISAMAYALASTVAAPFMGALADRFGRRRLVLVSLGAYILAFGGYLFASSALAFIALRALAGAFTAGLNPAVTGIVADLVPMDRRGQWIGVVNGGAAVGWIAGPLLGGMLYDRWGYGVALSVSISMAAAAFALALFKVPESHKGFGRSARGIAAGRTFRRRDLGASARAFLGTLPNPLTAFLGLLAVSFAVMFAWAFIEPRFMFYAYDDLGWSSSMLGLVMSCFGVSMALGEFGLGRLSDRLGRYPVIVLGLLLFGAQFMGLALFQNYVLIAAAFVVAGLGSALLEPALSAAVLDIAPAAHQARALGIKSTAGSLGNILGPALVVLLASSLAARGIFLAATGVVGMILLFVLFLRVRPRLTKIQKGEEA